ncbi:MAG TPA: TonB-dependent receptor plug domain-containing protein, partial [Chitinophagaceae bacterium]|nr:TonB-dependent receptor plug domain-containing protein [Chitinophagaceae bacterium]
FFLAALISLNCAGQNTQMNLLDSISGHVITQIRSSEKKNIFLTHDRSIYAAGEPIWFRAFVTNKFSGKLSHDGEPLFVDLVNINDSLVNKVLLNTSGIQTNNKIEIPDSVVTGYYWIRSYTSRSIQDDSAAIFAETLYIINPKKPASPQTLSAPTKKENKPFIEFSPEGGLFVTGSNSNVGLKITDPNGEPIALTGNIIDSRDSLITSFTSGKNGLGKFAVFPFRFRKYRAVINRQGKSFEYPLPPFDLYGAQLSVARQSDGSRTLRVLLEDSIHKKDFETYVIGVSNDSLCFASIGRGRYDVFVPDQKFPEGIATFFLFDRNFNCLSERSVFKRDDLQLEAKLNKKLYSKREKATLDISLADTLKNTVPALFTVSIADSSLSYLPDDSLEDFSGMSDEAIDLLMLNREPIHEKLFNEKSKMKNERGEDSLLYIKGTVLNASNEPVMQKVVTLFSGSAGLMPITDTTDFKGRFVFPLTYYLDSTQFAMQVSNLKGGIEKHQIKIDPHVFPHPKTPVFLKNKLEQFLKNPASQFISYVDTNVYKGNEWLTSVTVQNKRKKKNTYDVKRVTSFSTIIPGERFTKGGANNLSNAVLSVPGVQMLNGYVVIHGPSSMNAPDKTSEPIVIVDGVQMTLPESEYTSPLVQFLNTFDASQIEFVEVLKASEGMNYGVRGANGVISINTRKNVVDYSQDQSLKLIRPRGYSSPAFFPSINYDDKKNRASKETDNRGTLLWNGTTLLNEKGEASLTFFTNDIAGTYVVTIVGITARGNLIRKKITFNNR